MESSSSTESLTFEAFCQQILLLLDEGQFVATYKFAVLLGLLDVLAEHTAADGSLPTTVSTRRTLGEVGLRPREAHRASRDSHLALGARRAVEDPQRSTAPALDDREALPVGVERQRRALDELQRGGGHSRGRVGVLVCEKKRSGDQSSRGDDPPQALCARMVLS